MLERPRLAEAPEFVRAAVSELLGSPIRTEHAAAAGFTPSIASVVVGGGGIRSFVKAAPVGTGLGEAVEAGAVLAGVVGDIGPRLMGCTAAGDWRVAAYEVVAGEAVTWWNAGDVGRLRAVLERMRTVLDPCPMTGTSPYAAAFMPLLGTWQALSQGAASPDVAHLRGRPLPIRVPLPVLAELESRWSVALAADTALHHGDLRRDNVIREPDGRLRIVDWTHLWTAPGWMDVVRLVPDVAACGHDPERVWRDLPWRDAPDDHVNVALAGLAGRAWREGQLPDVPGSPWLRRMQREQGLHTMKWLEARLIGNVSS